MLRLEKLILYDPVVSEGPGGQATDSIETFTDLTIECTRLPGFVYIFCENLSIGTVAYLSHFADHDVVHI